MGFEKLTTTYQNHAGIWDVTQPSTAFSYQTGSVVRSGGSAQCLRSDFAGSVGVRSLGGNFSHLFCGSAWMFRNAAMPSTPTNCDFVLFDGATAQVGWVIRDDGSISVHAGSTTAATELGRTATGVIVAAGASGTGADYKMIEMEVVFHASAGTVTMKVADTTVLTLTGLNTAPSGAAQASRMQLRTRALNYVHCDDLYINDDSGSSPDNTFYGEAFSVEGIIPTGNGNSSQWVGSDGNSTDNYLLVDDTGNDDTDYVASGTLNDLDLYAMGDLSNATGTVIGVNHIMVAKKDDVATRTIASTIRTNSTDYVSATDKTMTGTYATYFDRRLTNPDTTLKFSIAEVNALEVGHKVTT